MRKLTVLLSAFLLSPVLAWGVTPQTWQHATEEDFAKGEFDGTVVTSLGEVRLSRQVTLLLASEGAPAVVSAVVRGGDNLYAASGNEAKVYRVVDGKADVLAVLPGAMVACLAWSGDELLAGTGGEAAGIYRISPAGAVTKLWAADGVSYVWAITRAADGRLYAAVGPQGRVFAVAADGTAEQLYKADKLAKNVLCLAIDNDGMLYAGTDDAGLVVQIDPRQKTSRVIFDADENEIASLIPDDRGGLFVATADASKAAPDGAAKPGPARGGKAQIDTSVPEEKPPQQDGDPEPAPADDEAGQAKDAGASKSEAVTETPEAKAATTQQGGDAAAPAKLPAAVSEAPTAPATATGAGDAETKPAVDADEPMDPEGPDGAEGPEGPQGPEGPEGPQGPDAAGQTPQPAAMAAAAGGRPGGRPQPAGVGNAVYYVRRDGLVETRFRRPVTILSMIMQDGWLLLGTGNGGGIYRVSIDGDESAQMADTEARQVTALMSDHGGRVLFATANKGSVGVLGEGLAASGRYTSEALDGGQMARWGTVTVRAHAPAGSEVTIATRSGNVSKAEDETWSEWSKPVAANGFSPIVSPAGRFLQYRLELAGDGAATPAVTQVELIYQVGNLPPALTSVDVQPSDKGPKPNISTAGPMAFRHVEIKASDPNGDKLAFAVEFRQAGGETWVQIAKDLDQPKYVWDTRTVGDGAYELRIRASDSPANPQAAALTATRVSNILVVDNTPPVVSDLGAKPEGDGLLVTGQATDAASRIVAIAYSIDSQDEWVVAEPADGICDSDREAFKFTVKDIDPGPHRLAVKVTDLLGNVAYASITATVAE